MAITVNGREWDTLEDALRYRHGHDSYPHWPKVYGGVGDASLISPEVVGYFDAEHDLAQKQEDRENEQ